MNDEELFKKAYYDLLNKKFYSKCEVKYSRKFKPFGSSIRVYLDKRKDKKRFVVSLSYSWKDVERDIKLGLFHYLISRVFKIKKNTLNMELYWLYIKNIEYISDNKTQDPFLREIFDKVNEEFFNNKLDYPNIKWGTYSFRTMGNYDFHTDTITISKTLKWAPHYIIEYVMYHEMLHKFLKFDHRKRIPRMHNQEFRNLENLFKKKYPNIDEEINDYLRKQKYKLKRIGLI